ncbi:hypothetical protein QQF64_012005 [Cirrhinus molitorella]|uniref:L1 transposable element RRM domain-containing protein n=1 Tax=Cirrhinus molitorella TaxID=172907 RepID=A0ABR3LU84_9TELE
MTKPKTDKGKKMDKVLNETPAQSPSESAEQAAAASGTSYGVDAEPVQNMSKTMTDRFDLLEASLASTQATLVSLGNRITEVENAAADYDRRLSLVEQKWLKIQSENISLREKLVDLEARSRRQNIRIVGLPEKIENGRPTEFLTEFIPDLLGASNFSKPLEVDRAHRLGRQSPGENARPRVMIARIHHFKMKEKILVLARQQFPLRYKDRPIYIFPDLPAEIMKRRQAFEDVRKQLRNAGVRNGFIYPARLRVSHGTTDKVFSSPEEAESFIGTLSQNS